VATPSSTTGTPHKIQQANCIVKPFISFTPSVSGTTLSVPSVYFISICIYNGFPIYGIVEMDNIHTLDYTVGKKKNRYGANVNERTSHIQCDWLIKNRHL
jgi:hypothetical protein